MIKHKKSVFLTVCKIAIVFGLIMQSQSSCTIKKKEKVSVDFLTPVKKYADAMITKGRDVYGIEHSPLFASTLNRETLKLEDKSAIPEIPGVREKDRSLTGANMIHDIDLFKLLYEISDFTGEKKYAEEANKAMQYFFNNCQSPATGLLCWGEHLYWDFLSDECGYAPNYDYHETSVWPFWDESYKLAPEACWKYAIGEWDNQINDKITGDFSRHGRYSKHGTFSGFEFPRYAGQMIERWADAYNRPENAARPRKEELLHYIEVIFNRMQKNMKLSKSGYLIAGQAEEGDHKNVVWLTSNLELARCLEVAAPIMNPKLAEQMRELALKQDDDFLNAPHKLDSVGGGFAVTLDANTGMPRTRSMNKPYTSTWSSGYGYGTHASTANACYGRYRKFKAEHPDLADRYKYFILMAANQYLNTMPDHDQLLKPEEFSSVIELMLNCFETTHEQRYLNRATYFGQLGIQLFLNDGLPLPKATNKNSHYEAITGGPSFMFDLLKIYIATKK